MGSIKNYIKNNPILRFLFRPLINWRIGLATRANNQLHKHYSHIFEGVSGGELVVSSKDFNGNFAFDYRSTLLRRFLIYGDYEQHLTRLVKKHLDPSRDVIDVGANIGLFSILFATLLKEGRRVLAIEPTPLALKRLKSNIDRNDCTGKLEIFEGLVSESEGTYELNYIEGMEEYASLGKLSHQAIEGEVSSSAKILGTTIDVLVEEKELNPGFLKIDVEGAEFEVLKGAIVTLNKYKPILLCEISDRLLKLQGSSSAQVFDYLQKARYSVQNASSLEVVSGVFEGDIIAFPQGAN